MKHIRYMTTGDAVCEKPTRLGYDFVILDYKPGDTEDCDPCSQLLTAYNKRQYESEGMVSTLQQHNRLYDPDPFTEGVTAGLALASGFWIVVALFIWSVWFR